MTYFLLKRVQSYELQSYITLTVEFITTQKADSLCRGVKANDRYHSKI